MSRQIGTSHLSPVHISRTQTQNLAHTDSPTFNPNPIIPRALFNLRRWYDISSSLLARAPREGRVYRPLTLERNPNHGIQSCCFDCWIVFPQIDETFSWCYLFMLIFHVSTQSCTFRIMLQSTFKIVICTLACQQRPDPILIRWSRLYWNIQHITREMSTSKPWNALSCYIHLHSIIILIYTRYTLFYIIYSHVTYVY